LGSIGVNMASANDSFDALGLNTAKFEFGGGGELVDLWRRIFVQGLVTHWSTSGERAFVTSAGNRFGLGIPLTVSATAVEFGAGWRFTGPTGLATVRRYTPFAGGGLGMTSYSESSSFARSGEDLDDSSASYHLFGGVEVSITRRLAIEM
jgi:hypothetical protein